MLTNLNNQDLMGMFLGSFSKSVGKLFPEEKFFFKFVYHQEPCIFIFATFCYIEALENVKDIPKLVIKTLSVVC